MLLDQRLVFVTAVMGEDTADDDALPRQGVANRLHLLLAETHLHAIFPQAGDNLLIGRLLEIGDDTLGYHLSDALHLHEFLQTG